MFSTRNIVCLRPRSRTDELVLDARPGRAASPSKDKGPIVEESKGIDGESRGRVREMGCACHAGRMVMVYWWWVRVLRSEVSFLGSTRSARRGLFAPRRVVAIHFRSTSTASHDTSTGN
jgi:hypothetical protein